jgi:uncharacterized protein (DUF2132 family)
MGRSTDQPNNPLHGVTLAMILERLVLRLGFQQMASAVDAPCFKNQPTIASSLKYLRRHPDARRAVEALYLRELG